MTSAYNVFLGALESVGTAATIISAGVYLHTRGFLTTENATALSKFSQQAALPLFLFSRSVSCPRSVTDSEEICPSFTKYIRHAWILLVWPVYVVIWGLVVGCFVSKCFRIDKTEHPVVLASIAFNNASALPITLLSVVEPFLARLQGGGLVDSNILLSIYMIAYPVLQWSIGGWLLRPPTDTFQHDEYDDEKSTMMKADPLQELDIDDAGYIEKVLYDIDHNSIESETTKALRTALEIFRNVVQAPVIGALLGIVVASIPVVRSLFVDTSGDDGSPPLGWLFQGVVSLGKAAVPVNMTVLGVNLASSLTSQVEKSVQHSTCFAVLFGKLIVMPAIGISTVLMLRPVLTIPFELRIPLLLVLMVQFISPTANNLMIMADVYGSQLKEGIAKMISWQYVCAPVILTFSFMFAVQVAIM
jgi:predicted permease